MPAAAGGETSGKARKRRRLGAVTGTSGAGSTGSAGSWESRSPVAPREQRRAGAGMLAAQARQACRRPGAGACSPAGPRRSDGRSRARSRLRAGRARLGVPVAAGPAVRFGRRPSCNVASGAPGMAVSGRRGRDLSRGCAGGGDTSDPSHRRAGIRRCRLRRGRSGRLEGPFRDARLRRRRSQRRRLLQPSMPAPPSSARSWVRTRSRRAPRLSAERGRTAVVSPRASERRARVRSALVAVGVSSRRSAISPAPRPSHSRITIAFRWFSGRAASAPGNAATNSASSGSGSASAIRSSSTSAATGPRRPSVRSCVKHTFFAIAVSHAASHSGSTPRRSARSA